MRPGEVCTSRSSVSRELAISRPVASLFCEDLAIFSLAARYFRFDLSVFGPGLDLTMFAPIANLFRLDHANFAAVARHLS